MNQTEEETVVKHEVVFSVIPRDALVHAPVHVSVHVPVHALAAGPGLTDRFSSLPQQRVGWRVRAKIALI